MHPHYGNQHPLYAEHAPDWWTMEDTFAGERRIKSRGPTYLSPTSGMIADGFPHANMKGLAAYNAYIQRARFPDCVKETVGKQLGRLNHKPAIIELPRRLEGMLDRATLDGRGLQGLLMQIHQQQLVTGRVPLLVDVPSDESAATVLPYISLYNAASVVNWLETITGEGNRLRAAVINESGNVADERMTWGYRQSYRFLRLGEDGYEVAVSPSEGMPPDDQFTAPRALSTLDEIPLVVVNSTRLGPSPEPPPLLGLAHHALGMYRLSADHRQALFLQAQETLVRTGALDGGGDGDVPVGAGAIIDLPANGDAKYIGVSAAGLSEMRQELENDRRAAAGYGAQLATKGQAESGEALRLRLGAATATLTSIATTAAEGLKHALQHAARLVDADPDQVIVEPNLDFADEEVEPKQLADLMTAKNAGLPLSYRSIHELLREKEFTHRPYEDELTLLQLDRLEFPGAGRSPFDIDPQDEE